MSAPFPNNESLRLEALYRLKVLDSQPEASFDRVTALAAHLYGTPMATVTFVDAERQWFKACVGMRDRESSRDIAFCAHTILSEQVLVVPDATLDERFREYANVTGEPHIRFYAGAPIVTSDGFAVGTLCVIDSVPRTQAVDVRALKDLAALTSELLETRLLSQRLVLTELARRDSEENYRLIVGEMRQAAFQIDCNGCWTFLNPAWTRITGQTLESTLGKKWTTYVHPEDKERAESFWRKMTLERTQQRDNLRFLDRSGGVLWLEMIACSCWNGPQTFSGVSGTLHDFTERVQSEALLREAKAESERAKDIAEAASEAKSAFVASVSHEIRTPLNAILGMAAVLAETKLSAEQAKYVEVFRRAGMNLLTLINDVLDLSKIEAGKMELDPVEFDLRSLVGQTLELIRPRVHEKGLALSLIVTDEVPATVYGDPLRLQQILFNLLGNATKFTEAGEISLTVSTALPPSAPGGVKFVVRDSGIGIPAEKLGTIFDDFEQADRSTTRAYGGTGLGLGIVRRLVSLMKGTLDVESVEGQGSTFTVTVVLSANGPEECKAQDLSPCLQDPATSLPAVTRSSGPVRLLIAEDTVDNQVLLEAYLSKSGHAFTFAQNGQEAIELFEKESFDLVLMDVQMPVMDGLKATRQIRLIESGKKRGKTPVVVLTANAAASDIEASKKAGADGHITKPIAKKDLMAAIEHYARDRRNTAKLM